jgi:hypothetical protein
MVSLPTGLITETFSSDMAMLSIDPTDHQSCMAANGNY